MNLVSPEMYELGSRRSAIRELFEYGKARAAVVGPEHVYDFSIGNPSVPPPPCVNEAVSDLVQTLEPVALHGYTAAQGDPDTRAAIAEDLNLRFGTSFHADNFYITVGAAASLTICFKALTCTPNDTFVAIAPYFPEYKVFVENVGAQFDVVPPDTEHFQINWAELESRIGPNTRAVIVNSPNNPSGTVYSEETIEKLADLLRRKSAEFGRPVFLISDEPYREIVYDGFTTPFLTKYYDNTLVCYSFSKSLSLPGERIGYVLVPDAVCESKSVYAAVCGAGRALGYVCAPSLFQKVIARCVGQTGDIEQYRRNRDLLYRSLTEMGYRCVYPRGAFYLFVQALEPDANAFCERAKEMDLLLVSASDFGCPGFVRISYCVSETMIRRALPVFEKLAKSYREIL